MEYINREHQAAQYIIEDMYMQVMNEIEREKSLTSNT